MNNYLTINLVMQAGLIGFSIAGFALTGLKLPQYGLIASLISQIFWLYSSYKAWKNADQIGIFITTVVIALIVLGGVINYWFLS